MTPTRALTLWPEWAWAIHHLDKRVENRTWKIPMGEWFGLHAGKCIGGRPGPDAEEDGLLSLVSMAERAGWSHGGPLNDHVFLGRGPKAHLRGKSLDCRACDPPCSAMCGWRILGAFRVTRHDAPGYGDLTGWRVPDQVGNVFEYRPFVEPVLCKGAQGLWAIPADVRGRIEWEVERG